MVGVMNSNEGAPEGLNLAERIRRLANGRSTIDVAQFQFIGLDEIRERYGPRWNERREKVQQVAGDFIARRIAPEDVMIPGADGFLLVFGARSGVLADAAAQRISTELNTFFLGASEIEDDVSFIACHRSMSVDDFAEAFGDLIAESRQLAQQAERVRRTAGDTPMGFAPVWDARRGALTTYFVTPLDRTDRSRPDDGHEPPHGHTELDELKLKASEEAMRGLFETGRKALVGVALHVSSLNSQTNLARLYASMAKFDRQLVRYRIVRVSGVEPGFPRIYLDDIVRTLRTRIPNVAIGLNWTEPDLASVIRLQPSAVAFTLPPGCLSSVAMRADVFARVHSAIEMTRPHAIPVCVEGDIAPEFAQRFASEGVHLIASPLIWPALPALPAAQIWPASHLAEAARCESPA